MRIDLTGIEETTLNTFVERAIADDCHPPSPRIRTLGALVAKLEPAHAVAPLLAAGPDDRPRRKSKR
jgi:hypothetical protein